MDRKREHPDPLHDGSLGSYVLRFIIGLILGICANVFFTMALCLYNWIVSALPPETVFVVVILWLVIPVFSAVFAVFKFDWIVRVYDSLHDWYVGLIR